MDNRRWRIERCVVLYLGSNEMAFMASMKFDNNLSNLVHERFIGLQCVKVFVIGGYLVLAYIPWHKKEKEASDLTCMDFREFEWPLDTILLIISSR
jgi:hypothetical protein